MNQTQNSRRLIASVAGCADPQKPFNPTSGNNCSSCRQHSDITCYDFPAE